MSLLIFKSPSSMRLLELQYLRNRLKELMESTHRRVLSVPVRRRKRRAKEKLPWRRKVMCRWMRHPMRTKRITIIILMSSAGR